MLTGATSLARLQHMIDLSKPNSITREWACLHSIQISITRANLAIFLAVSRSSSTAFLLGTLEHLFIRAELQKTLKWAAGNCQIQAFK